MAGDEECGWKEAYLFHEFSFVTLFESPNDLLICEKCWCKGDVVSRCVINITAHSVCWRKRMNEKCNWRAYLFLKVSFIILFKSFNDLLLCERFWWK